MRDPVEKLMVSFLTIHDGNHPAEEIIESSLRQLALVNPNYSDISDDEFSWATEEIKKKIAVTTDFGSVLTGVDHKPWLEEKKASMSWDHFESYTQYLRIVQNLTPQVIKSLDDMTDLMLDLAGDPEAEGSWHRKGLVIGSVQSGKTSNIVGLLNKAADAGYKLFIVIGGHTTDLRRQTQLRIDEGFAGRDTQDLDLSSATLKQRRKVGVGLNYSGEVKVQSFTTEVRDFSSVLMKSQNYQLTADMTHPVVLVVKKVSRVLENINLWLESQSVGDMPFLVIDDESDFASVNTKKEGQDPTSVNREIRRMLSMSKKSTYVAFTATPFANILIDSEITHTVAEEELADLFPKDFILSLESPSNYVGPEEIFGVTPKLPNALKTEEMIDCDDAFPFRQNSGHFVDLLPHSLYQAIATFLAACAIRAQRGDAGSRKSMMVNVSHYKSVQRQSYDLVSSHVKKLRRDAVFCLSDVGVRTKDSRLISEILECAQKEYGLDERAQQRFLVELKKQVAMVNVQLRNSESGADETQDGLNTIYVGGHVLSRGLTLDGLVVSYFTRTGSAMDSLLQMGRWFGYRDRYEDLVRIWIREEVALWFTKITDVISDVLSQIREMNKRNSSPEHFGLRIRLNPGRLRITAASKARAATEMRVDVSLAGFGFETSTLHEKNFGTNWQALRTLLEQIESSSYPLDSQLLNRSGRKVFRDIPGHLVSTFLESFKFLNSPLGSLTSLTKRISEHGSKVSFDVAIAEGRHKETLELPGPIKVQPLERTLTSHRSQTWQVTTRRRVATEGDLRRSLRVDDLEKLQKRFGESERESDVRICMSTPILTLFPIIDKLGWIEEPVAAYSLHFPTPDAEESVNGPAFTTYLYNTVAFKQVELFDWDEIDAEDADEDDE